jgi:hypothetical protein
MYILFTNKRSITEHPCHEGELLFSDTYKAECNIFQEKTKYD